MSVTTSEIAAVAFDAVGTLIEPFPSVARAYADAAERQGVVLDPAEVKTRFGRWFRVDEVDETKGPMATDEAIERARWRRIVGNVLPEVADPERAFQELWDHFGRATAWRVFDDVVPALEILRTAGVPFVTASNFDARLRSVLAGLPGLSDLAESAVISSLVGYRKPHSRFYACTAEALGVDPARVLFIGDDPVNDLEGPRRAGMSAARLDRGGGSAESDLLRLLRSHLGDR
ncbi:MAG: HAD-IA family hydrolase [Isosphaeraceae bacterium]|nr:HAD-IA family hydrolase [Isosphaeraceae bacterium]